MSEKQVLTVIRVEKKIAGAVKKILELNFPEETKNMEALHDPLKVNSDIEFRIRLTKDQKKTWEAELTKMLGPITNLTPSKN